MQLTIWRQLNFEEFGNMEIQLFENFNFEFFLKQLLKGLLRLGNWLVDLFADWKWQFEIQNPFRIQKIKETCWQVSDNLTSRKLRLNKISLRTYSKKRPLRAASRTTRSVERGSSVELISQVTTFN